MQTLTNYLIWQDEILTINAQRKSMMEVRGLDYDTIKVQSPTSDPMPNLIITLEKLDLERNRLLRLQDEILYSLSQMSNKRYSKILTYRYIVGMTWDEIADAMDVSPRWSRVLCKRAENRYYSLQDEKN